MRLFIALTLPPETRAALCDVQARMPQAGRAVPEEHMHLTLAFLGDQTADMAEALHEGLETLRAPAVPLELSGATLLGGRHGQAVGLEADGGEELMELYDRVRSRLRGAGLTLERRRFRPHVTLARMTGSADASGALGALTGARIGPAACTAFSLISSHLHRDGARHEVLASYPLGALSSRPVG